MSGTRYCSYFTIHIAISSWLAYTLSTVQKRYVQPDQLPVFFVYKFLFGHLCYSSYEVCCSLLRNASRWMGGNSFWWRRPSLTLHRRMESASKVQHVSVRIYTETSAASAWVVWNWMMKWTSWPASSCSFTHKYIYTHHAAIHECWFYIFLLDQTRPLISNCDIENAGHPGACDVATGCTTSKPGPSEAPWGLSLGGNRFNVNFMRERGEGFWVKNTFWNGYRL